MKAKLKGETLAIKKIKGERIEMFDGAGTKRGNAPTGSKGISKATQAIAKAIDYSLQTDVSPYC